MSFFWPALGQNDTKLERRVGWTVGRLVGWSIGWSVMLLSKLMKNVLLRIINDLDSAG